MELQGYLEKAQLSLSLHVPDSLEPAFLCLSGMQCLEVSGPLRDPEFLLSPSKVFPEIIAFWG